jgi:hypothetical protein
MSTKIAICLWGEDACSSMDAFEKNVTLAYSGYSIDLFIATYDGAMQKKLKEYKNLASVTFVDRTRDTGKDNLVLLRAVLMAASNAMRYDCEYCKVVVLRTGVSWRESLSILKPIDDRFNVLSTIENANQLPTDLWIFDGKSLAVVNRILSDKFDSNARSLQVYIERIFGNLHYMHNSETMYVINESQGSNNASGETVVGFWGEVPQNGISPSLINLLSMYRDKSSINRMMVTPKNPWMNLLFLQFIPSHYSFITCTETDCSSLQKLLHFVTTRSDYDTVILLHASFNPASEFQIDKKIPMQYENGIAKIMPVKGSEIVKLESLLSGGELPSREMLNEIVKID